MTYCVAGVASFAGDNTLGSRWVFVVDLLLVTVGVVLLAAGGEGMVRGALSVAKRMNMSPLLVGLVIVGFGTSAPELVVSIDAALNQRPDIAIGNVVGSNIGNVSLILGACALVTPLAVRPLALRRDAVVVVTASVLFVVLVGGAALARSDALVLLAAFGVYLVWAYRSERREGARSFLKLETPCILSVFDCTMGVLRADARQKMRLAQA